MGVPAINRVITSLALIVLVVMAIVFYNISVAAGVDRMKVVIGEDGVVRVNLTVSVDPGLNELKLPIEPIVASISARIDGNSTPVFYSNGTLYLPSKVKGVANIGYLAKVVIGKKSSWFYIVTNDAVRIDIAPNIILLGTPRNLINSTIYDSHLVMTVYGPLVVNYTITEATAGGISQKSPSLTTSGEGQVASNNFIRNLLVIVIILTVLFALLFKYKLGSSGIGSKGKKGTFTGERDYAILKRDLDSTDWKIIEYLKDKGGEAYQSEIRYALHLPKATLSRRIGKLSRLGIIDVVKEGKMNKVILKKDINRE